MSARLTPRDHILRSIPEDDFQDQVIALAQLLKWKVAHFRSVKVQRRDGTTYYQTPVQADGRGFPDLILCRGKRQIATELKSEGGTVTAEQQAWLDTFSLAGAETDVWRPRDWDRLEAMLR